jgi:hypothetical protein
VTSTAPPCWLPPVNSCWMRWNNNEESVPLSTALLLSSMPVLENTTEKCPVTGA